MGTYCICHTKYAAATAWSVRILPKIKSLIAKTLLIVFRRVGRQLEMALPDFTPTLTPPSEGRAHPDPSTKWLPLLGRTPLRPSGQLQKRDRCPGPAPQTPGLAP